MSMKKILMAAVAVSALTAGSASAAKFSPADTKVGQDSSYTSTTGVAVGDSTNSDPMTLANELTTTSSTISYASIVVTPNGGSTATSVGQGNYVVTFNFDGGTISSPSSITTSSLAAEGNGGTAGDISVTSVGTASANSVSFNFTVNTGKYLGKLTLKAPILVGISKATVNVSGNLTSSNSAVDGGAITSIPLIDYRNGYSFTLTKATSNPKLSIASGFKKFTSDSGDVTSAALATGAKFIANTGTLSTDKVYKSTVASGNEIATSDITKVVLTATGDLSAMDLYLGSGKQGADDAASPAVITANSTNLTALTGSSGADIGLKQKTTAVAGGAGSYTISAVPSITGLTPVTYAAKAMADVVLEGTNFYATWVGDGSSGTTYSIRLGNRTSSEISSVKAALMNPSTTGTSGTVASSAACEVGPLPKSGELLIRSEELVKCFGAFKRSDVRLTIQADSSLVTAKMRTISGTTVTESPLGTGSEAAAK